MPSSDLRQLVKQEKLLKASLENVQEFVDNYQEDRDKDEVELRLMKLDEIFDKFSTVRVEFDVILDEAEDTKTSKGARDDVAGTTNADARADSSRAYKDFENIYFRLKSALLVKLPRNPGIVAERQQVAANPLQTSRMKYPELKLPTFSGKLQEWINFRDNFKSLIHNNGDLSTMDKFNYLRASLRDNALLQINQVQVTAATYHIAWTILETKYENHKLIAQEHLKALFAVPAMRSESFETLNTILMTFKVNLQQLAKLGEITENWSTILAFMLSQKLDTATLRHWETHHASKDIPQYAAMAEFLEQHCAILHSTSGRCGVEQRRPFKSSALHTAIPSTSNCQICNGGQHCIDQCRRFSKMRVVDRKMIIRRLGLCLNCLCSGHFVADCSRRTCAKCGQRHHYLLHPYAPPNSNTQSQPQNNPNRPQAVNANPQTQPRPPYQVQQQSQSQSQCQSRTNNTQSNPQTSPVLPTTSQFTRQPPPTNTPSTSHHTATSHNIQSQRNTALLSTAIVKLADRSGNTILVRALLDNGSQICMITENISQRLNFKRFRENLPVNGVGDSSTVCKQSVLAKILSRYSSFETTEVKFYVLPRITLNLPQHNIDISSWKLPADIRLADPSFFESSAVDAILGVSVFYELLLGEQMRLWETGPILCNTKLGWIMAGEISENPVSTFSVTVATSGTTEEIHEQLARFWELETCRTKSCLSIEESTCESIFEQTTTRDHDGRFRVTLPKKEYVMEQLGESKAIATKRFMALEKRLNANPEMKALYTAFIHEYLLMGHMKEITDDEDEPRHTYYMPHHAVMKPDSTTTKLRVVFDASCATDSGVSLNDALMVGPVVQRDLLCILIYFRLHKYAIVGDVEKMYRMINVILQDQSLLRILWRESVDEPLRTYQLTTVTYGTSSAPYLVTRCLKKCAEEGEETHPVAANAIKNNFYVDDMLTGAHSVKEGQQLCTDILSLLDSAGFNLRKLHSNQPAILKGIPSYLRDKREILDIDSTSTVKTLESSIWWNGPKWLQEESNAWPRVNEASDQHFDSATLEEKPLVTAALQMLPPSEIFTMHSSLLKLIHFSTEDRN
ncbi:uncharacterized protein LOC135702685 [Ochlerotatus camptorhynchus]|uniref:uncharacterized protein LOC135702685 n=1 Tax=Ochlerotatus camptorhynchus TaxID=644619 RepID=UPI0031DD7E13